MSDELLNVRANPCSSCPYRRDVPSGVWSAVEYDKLTQYDGDLVDQARAGAGRLFMCHQQDGKLCAGWVGCHDMSDNLAVRINWEQVHPDVLDYFCLVPLFESGAAAAEHGKRDIENPSPQAQRAIRMITLIRSRTSRPVTTSEVHKEADNGT